MSETKIVPAKYIFLDIVGFTHNRNAEAQAQIVEVLNHIVESSILEHRIPKEKVLFLPASDDIGIALLNVESPEDLHLRVALSIVREVHKYSSATKVAMRKFEVRVGINSNTDNLVTDINGNQNVAGAGVNLASRVMRLADGNQILVSQPVFDVLQDQEKYVSSFKAFRAKVKHGLEMPVYQFTAEEFEGLNTATPSHFQDVKKTESQNVEQTFYAATPRRNSSSISKQNSELSLSETQFLAPESSAHTQSYLHGILAESPKSETRQTPAKTPETLNFLEQVEPTGRDRSFVWAALILLLMGCVGFAAWTWLRRENLEEAQTAPVNTTTQTAPSASIASNTVSLATSQTANQTNGQETVSPSGATPKSDTPFKSKPAATSVATETRGKITVESDHNRQAKQQRFTAQRPTVQRTVSQRLLSPTLPKRQIVKAEKPKRNAKITIDDLTTKPSSRITIDDFINNR